MLLHTYHWTQQTQKPAAPSGTTANTACLEMWHSDFTFFSEEIHCFQTEMDWEGRESVFFFFLMEEKKTPFPSHCFPNWTRHCCQRGGDITLPSSVADLLLHAWCPCFWGKFLGCPGTARYWPKFLLRTKNDSKQRNWAFGQLCQYLIQKSKRIQFSSERLYLHHNAMYGMQVLCNGHIFTAFQKPTF